MRFVPIDTLLQPALRGEDAFEPGVVSDSFYVVSWKTAMNTALYIVAINTPETQLCLCPGTTKYHRDPDCSYTLPNLQGIGA